MKQKVLSWFVAILSFYLFIFVFLTLLQNREALEKAADSVLFLVNQLKKLDKFYQFFINYTPEK